MSDVKVDCGAVVDGQFARVGDLERPRIAVTFNGRSLQAMQGDTVLTAILLNVRNLGQHEFTGHKRAGFCLMGACQDCWVRLADGSPIRACTTLVEPGMVLHAYPIGVYDNG